MKFVVREIVKEDLPILYKFVTDHEIAYMTNNDRDMTYEDFRAKYELYFSGRAEDLKIFAVLLDNKIIGKMEIGYDLYDKTAQFEIIIGNKQLWGRGIAVKALNVLFSYAFNNLGMNRLSCEVFRFNERSLQLMKKMGMHVDGMLREAQYVHNKYVDIVIFSILKREYEGDV